MAEEIEIFLKTAKKLTQNQTGKKYVTLGLSAKWENKLRKRCDRVILEGDPVLAPIATKMLPKLDEYLSRVATEQTTLWMILNPNLPNDLINESGSLRRHVVLPLQEFADSGVVVP